MDFEEFLAVLSHAKPCEARHFKPYSEPILNSHHPEIKDEVFIIMRRGDKFEVIYPNRDDALHETFSDQDLARIFDEREWGNFIPYDPDADILEWLEHPIWGVYI